MVNLDYFYGSEGEQYRFYQIPAILLEDEEYKKISDTAKLLYGILLSRLALSKKNNWIEKETNRVYILYNRNDIAKKMGKCPATISNAMNQLLEVGLIKRKRQGQGKADMLYVMNFSSGEHKKTVNIQCEERKEVPASPDQPHSFYEDREEKVYTNDSDIPSLQNKRAAYREIIKKQVDYDILRQSPYDKYPYGKPQTDEVARGSGNREYGCRRLREKLPNFSGVSFFRAGNSSNRVNAFHICVYVHRCAVPRYIALQYP